MTLRRSTLFSWTLFALFLVVSGNVGFVIGLSLLPIGTGVAILKYRLYDLERIVNRALHASVWLRADGGPQQERST